VNRAVTDYAVLQFLLPVLIDV